LVDVILPADFCPRVGTAIPAGNIIPDVTTANIERFSGYASDYDGVRPQPPAAALDVLCEVLGTPSPGVVVDLAAGTGLSTRQWIGRARRLIGVEPNDDMRGQALRATPAGAAEYVSALAEATGLPDLCADIVTCVQAFHWLEPTATITEVNRLLRSGGVFAVLDCDWPPYVHWQLLEPWRALRETAESIVTQRALAPGLRRWPKAGHLDGIRGSGAFRATAELCFHQRTSGDAQRLLALARSQGGLATALKAGDPDAERATASFGDHVRAVLGDAVVPWTYTYRVRLGVK
jgi:SAM-dependent methyltransferase